MSKQAQTDNEADRLLRSWGFHGDLLPSQRLRAAGFTICGADEIPMPKEPPADAYTERHVWWNETYVRLRDAYQRERAAQSGEVK